MRLEKITALIAALLSIPFVSFATYCWLVARADNYQGFIGIEADLAGEAFYMLGAPLTLIVLKFPDYAGRRMNMTDDLWAIPLLIILFVGQWIIWSQIIARLIRLMNSEGKLK